MTFPVCLHKQQTYPCPHKLAQSYYQCGEYSGSRSCSETCRRHEESALASAYLQRHEEQQVGKQTCERQYQYALHKAHAGRHQCDDDVNLSHRAEAARQFQHHCGCEPAFALCVQRRRLAVYVFYFLTVARGEGFHSLFQHRHVACEVYQF